METLKNIGFNKESNVKYNIEISKECTYIVYENEVEIHEVINVPMGVILLGSLQKEKFNYNGGGAELHKLNRNFKKECFDFLLNTPELHSFSKEINGEMHTWSFTGKSTKSGNAIYTKN